MKDELKLLKLREAEKYIDRAKKLISEIEGDTDERE